MTAGHCVACGTLIWRGITHGVTGERVLLYPTTTSRYATIGTPLGVVPGLGYCLPCTPVIGAPGPPGDVVTHGLPPVPLATGAVLRIETATDRYHAWFTDGWGDWLRAWLHDEAKLDAVTVTHELDAWQRAREGT